MKKISLLFLDHQISNYKTQKAISEAFNLFLFDFMSQFRELISKEDNELTKEIKSFINNASVIPNNYLEEVLKIQLGKIESQNILLTNFPRTKEQFLMLDNIFLNLNIQIDRIWLIKQKNPDDFLKKYFENPENKKWLDKFGDEVLEKWKEEHFRKNQFITEIQKLTENTEWKIVGMDYNSDINEELIINKINGSA